MELEDKRHVAQSLLLPQPTGSRYVSEATLVPPAASPANDRTQQRSVKLNHTRRTAQLTHRSMS